jgi:hypothetical protein
MTERPILFSAPMVRAILDGGKTQTRRVVKSKREPVLIPFAALQSEMQEHLELLGWRQWTKGHLGPPCPYGQPGDRLWVRESFAKDSDGYVYKATCPWWDSLIGKKPSIHMPRDASRITLEITDVRVERLQHISEVDAQAEGAFFAPDAAYKNSFKQGFENLWQSINGPESWDANPWVWVVSFKQVKGGA